MNGIPHLRAAAMAALLYASSPAAGAEAQSRQLMNADEVRQCLCREQVINGRQGEFEMQRALLRERQVELGRLSAEILRLTATMNPNDAAAAAYLQQLRARQQALQAQAATQGWQNLKARRDDLSLLIEDYNQLCTTRPRLRVTEAEARRNLQCPQQ